jgi:hypothetical protein
VDTTNGRVMVIVATAKPGATSSLLAYDGRFRLHQQATAPYQTNLTLAKLSGCTGSTAAASRPAVAAAQMNMPSKSKPPAKPKPTPPVNLWAHDTGGKWSTVTGQVATSVSGTRWLTEETCTGTLVRVTQGSVQVRNLITGLTVTLHAGQHYDSTAVAQAPQPGPAQPASGPGGSTTVIADGALLTSSGDGFGSVTAAFPADTTFDQLTLLSATFTMEQGTAADGSPRFQVDVSRPRDENRSDELGLYVSFATQQSSACPAGKPQAAANIVGSPTAAWHILGGTYDPDTPYTYAVIRAMFADYQLLDAQITLDGGYSQASGEQQMLLQNWRINSVVRFPEPVPAGGAPCAS